MTGENGKGVAETVTGVPNLRRILAPNPSPMTGPGTWTYLLGREEVLIVDPGPNNPAHLAAILAAIPLGARVAGIIITHAHLDHSALVPAVATATKAPVLAFGPANSGRSPVMQQLAESGFTAGGEGVDLSFQPDLLLKDGDKVGSDDGTFVAVHTPGHMGGHLCLALEDVLLTGDHVMAWAPSLVSPPDGDMGAYMQSLERLLETPWRKMLPSHGEAILEPEGRLRELIRHRRNREAQILAALRSGPATVSELTRAVYHDIAPPLLPAAERNALAHLIDLEQRNLVAAEPLISVSAQWSLS